MRETPVPQARWIAGMPHSTMGSTQTMYRPRDLWRAVRGGRAGRRRTLPHGWWILPALVVGVAIWAAVAALVLALAL